MLRVRFAKNVLKDENEQILNRNLLVSVSEFRVMVSVSNIDTIPPGIARLIPIPRVSLNSILCTLCVHRCGKLLMAHYRINWTFLSDYLGVMDNRHLFKSSEACSLWKVGDWSEIFNR